METIWRRKDGILINILLTSSFINGGRKSGTIFTALDITELKKTTQDLKKDEARIESLFELSQKRFDNEDDLVGYVLEECIELTDSEVGYFHFAYDSGDVVNLGLFKWSKGTLRGCKAAVDRHYPLEAAGIWADCVRLRRPVIHNDYDKYPAKKGLPEGHFPIKRHMSVPIFDDNGRLVAIVGVGNKALSYEDADVRQLMLFVSNAWRVLERNRTIKSLEFSENRFKKVIEFNSDAIVLVDKDGIMKYVNPAMESITGMFEDSLLGKQFGFPLVDGGISSIDIVDSDGKTKCVEIRVAVVDLEGEDHYLVSMRDFTDKVIPCVDDKKECVNENSYS